MACAAFRMWSVTACAERSYHARALTSMMSRPPAGLRPDEVAPAALSPVATTAQDGSFFQAGGPERR